MSYFLLTLVPFLLSLVLSSPTATSVANPPFGNLTTPFALSLWQPGFNGSGGDPQYKCAKSSFIRTDHRPGFSECYRAIRALPLTHDQGNFHTSGLNDVWRLPRVERFGQCRVQVEVENRARVPGSWVSVVAALDQLNVLCRRTTRGRGERTGGWMLIAPANKIKVSILGPKDPDIPHVVS